MNDELLQQMAGLGVSINVAVSDKLHASFNSSEQLSTEVGELRRYITQQQVANDDTLYRILAAIESHDYSGELALLLQGQAASSELLHHVCERMDVLEGLSAQQVRMLQQLAVGCELQMKEACEWSQHLHDSMARWEVQLEQQTAAVIGRIDEMDDRRHRADAEQKQLLHRLLRQGDVHSRQLHKVLDLHQHALHGQLQERTPAASPTTPSTPTGRSSKVRELTLARVQVQFDDESLLGEGAGGKVYWGRLEGVLPAGRDEVAVKKLVVSTPSHSAGSAASSGRGGARGRGRGRGRGAAAAASTATSTRSLLSGSASNSESDNDDPLVRAAAT